MNGPITPAQKRRRALALSVLAAVVLAASLGTAGEAKAAYKTKLDGATLKITGDGASDKLVLRLQFGSPGTLEVDVGADGTADFSFDRSTFTAIEVEAGAGNDEVRVDLSNGSFADESLTINGGDGADTLVGGTGAETLLGGKGNDIVAGRDGNDRVLGGDGDDRFPWNPGDDSDTVEGQGGIDLLDFFGANIGETIGVSANGSHVRFTRDVANVALDLNDVERVGFHAFGGADTITVDDLTGTDATTVALDLNAVGGVGDAQPDTVTVKGTSGGDNVTIGPTGGDVLVSGLSAQVQVAGSETTLDNVNVATLAGADAIITGTGITGPAFVNVDGGDDGDTARYVGTPAADEIAIAANGTAVATYTPGTTPVSTTVESLAVLGLGGADMIAGVGNLAPLTALTIDGGEGGDTLRGGNGADVLLGGSGDDSVDGNQGADTAFLGIGDDRFQWDPGDGNDTVEGEAGSDTLDFFGSNIGETIGVSANGSHVRFTRDIANIALDLDDVETVGFRAFGGTDTITVDDLAGTDAQRVALDLSAAGGGGDLLPDTVTVRGTNGPDRVTIGSAAGEVFVSGLSATVQVAGSESALDNVNVTTLGGADTITSGVGLTGPAFLNVDGGDDADTARYNGTADADEIAIAANGTAVATYAPGSTPVNTTAIESLAVLGLGGADTISGVGNLAPLTALTIDGGEGDDTLRGGNGADLLLGGAGDDSVDGNQGSDTALLGDGDDRFEWNPGDGNDTVDGEAGSDTLDFFGSGASETITVTADGRHARLTRNVASITMDLDNVEEVAVHTLGGSDLVIVDDVTGTDVETVTADLGAFGGGGDAQLDTIVANGTKKRDTVAVDRSGAELLVSGLPAQLRIVGSEGASDTLLLQTLGGDDDVTVAPTVPDLINPVVNLGADE